MSAQKGRKSSGNGASKKRRSSAKRAVGPEDLYHLHFISDPQIAPDGKVVLFTKKHVGEKNEYVSNLWVVPVDGGAPRQFTAGSKDSHGRWSPDGATIAFLSSRDKPRPQIFTMPAAGGEATPLTRFPEGSLKSFKWSPDGAMLAVAFRETESEWTEESQKRREESGESVPPRVIDDLFYRLDGDGYFNDRRFHLYIVDAASGAHRLLRREKAGWFDFDWSPDSSELVVASNVSREPLLNMWKDELFRVDARSGKTSKISDVPKGNKEVVRWSPNDRLIAFAGRKGKEVWGVKNTRLFLHDLEKNRTRDLTGAEDYCLSATTLSDTAEPAFNASVLWSPDSRRLFMHLAWHGESHIASIAADGGTIAFHTEGRCVHTIGNVSNDGKRIAMTVAGPTRPSEIAVADVPAKPDPGGLRPRRLTRFNDSLLNELHLVEPEPHWIDSSDGTRVQLWALKPVGFKNNKRYPAVLEIHGGPHTQYGEALFHEFQTLAASGYVVVYSNPRGSKGYGEAHCEAIKGSWGQADWRDVRAVIEFMKNRRYIDSKRMGVMGGSYGGYLTNWIIGHANDFAAAVTDRCVSNLVSMVGSSDLPLVPGEYWDANSWDNIEPIWEQSPLKYFGNVETPTLVIHSEGDLRCNIEQSEQVFAALKLRKIPARFVRYPASTSHGLSRSGPPDLRIHRLEQILDWWKTHLT